MEVKLLCGLNENRGAVCQHLSDALHHLGRIVSRADNRICSQFGRVLQHQVESFLASFFAEIRKQRDVATDQRLQSGADGAED